MAREAETNASAAGAPAAGLLVSVQVGPPRDIVTEAADDGQATRWHSGFFKTPVAGPVRVGRLTLAGDGQADLAVHGGPDRPVLAYNAAHYDAWRAELGIADAGPGWFGENFTVRGHDEHTVCLGDVYAVGPDVRLEVSQPRQPCWKLARRWGHKDLPARVIQHDRGGWYLRTLAEGHVEAGMTLALLDRPFPTWTIARANHVIYHGRRDPAATAELMNLRPLSEQWRQTLARRLG